MQNGRYPLEPYGALGGLYGKSSKSVASGLGTVVGTLIGLLAVSGFQLIKFLLGWITRNIHNGFRGFYSGIKSGLQK